MRGVLFSFSFDVSDGFLDLRFSERGEGKALEMAEGEGGYNSIPIIVLGMVLQSFFYFCECSVVFLVGWDTADVLCEVGFSRRAVYFQAGIWDGLDFGYINDRGIPLDS